MLFRDIENCVQPVKGGLEVEIVPEAMAEDEGVRTIGLLDWEESTEAVELVRGNGEADHHFDLRVESVIDYHVWKEIMKKLTDDIDRIGWAC